MDKLEIYNCRVSLDKTGWKTTYDPITVVETVKTYKSGFQTIRKEKLLSIESVYRENTKFMKFYTYCTFEQKAQAEDILKSHIVGKLVLFKNDLDVLFSFL